MEIKPITVQELNKYIKNKIIKDKVTLESKNDFDLNYLLEYVL